MDFLKSLFDEGALTWEQFSKAVTDKGFKLADLATGKYVSQAKFTSELEGRDKTISDLQSQISDRDNDLSTLKTKLETAGTDNKTKIEELNKSLTNMQSTYETTKNQYEEKLAKQSYEFAVRDFANSQKFTSNAAKRDFISEMIKKDLKVENNTILGADDFVKVYSEQNGDAFVKEEPNPDPKPNPTFVNPSTKSTPEKENAFIDAFNFVGVRPHNNN